MLLMQGTVPSQGFFSDMGTQTHDKSRHTSVIQMVYVYVCVCVCVRARVYIYIYIYIYIYLYIYLFISLIWRDGIRIVRDWIIF